ncbi:protein phosphatase 1, regulatory (inhibitor) subunit 14Aa isoform X2 [Syngnathoides biaculeatus]|uniref:protein phosphatase 1, regulatory (inhibitor) subunit 14Aa isoform X2 n=1 Tax=Syngnathoides biaculeatus TaxID=300417 RepID=UPI002ADE1FBC|nr:protein phosphatase 1, regulatory (inhibitor) subunit 14Aa isoform X2 [Syngnathoides biaculeatus]
MAVCPKGSRRPLWPSDAGTTLSVFQPTSCTNEFANLFRYSSKSNVLFWSHEGDLPEEVNIDDLIDLADDVERIKKLRELLQTCNNDTETFIRELIEKLEGVHKEEELQSEGVEHPVISHSHHRHEPYHFNNPHRVQHARGHDQTL